MESYTIINIKHFISFGLISSGWPLFRPHVPLGTRSVSTWLVQVEAKHQRHIFKLIASCSLGSLIVREELGLYSQRLPCPKAGNCKGGYDYDLLPHLGLWDCYLFCLWLLTSPFYCDF